MANIFDDLVQGSAQGQAEPASPAPESDPAQNYFAGISGVPEKEKTGVERLAGTIETGKKLWENREKVGEMVVEGTTNLAQDAWRGVSGSAEGTGYADASTAMAFRDQYANAETDLDRERVFADAKRGGLVTDEAKFKSFLSSSGTKTKEEDVAERAVRQDEDRKMEATGVWGKSKMKRHFFDIANSYGTEGVSARGMAEIGNLADAMSATYEEKWQTLNGRPGGMTAQDKAFLEKFANVQEAHLRDMMDEARKARKASGDTDYDFVSAEAAATEKRRKELLKISAEFMARRSDVNRERTADLAKKGFSKIGEADILGAASDILGSGVNWLSTGMQEVADVGSIVSSPAIDAGVRDFSSLARADIVRADAGVAERNWNLLSRGFYSVVENAPEILVSLAGMAGAFKKSMKAQEVVETALSKASRVAQVLEKVEDQAGFSDWAIAKGVRIAGEAAQNAVVNPMFSASFNVMAGGQTFDSDSAYEDFVGNLVGDSLFYAVLRPQFRDAAAAKAFKFLEDNAGELPKGFDKEALAAIQRGDYHTGIAIAKANLESGKTVESVSTDDAAMIRAALERAKSATPTEAALIEAQSRAINMAGEETGSSMVREEAKKSVSAASAVASEKYRSVLDGSAPNVAEKSLALGEVLSKLFFRDAGAIKQKSPANVLRDLAKTGDLLSKFDEATLSAMQDAAKDAFADKKNVNKAYAAVVTALFKASQEGKVPDGFNFGRLAHTRGKWVDVVTGEDLTQKFLSGEIGSHLAVSGVGETQFYFDRNMLERGMSITSDNWHYLSKANPEVKKMFVLDKATGEYVPKYGNYFPKEIRQKIADAFASGDFGKAERVLKRAQDVAKHSESVVKRGLDTYVEDVAKELEHVAKDSTAGEALFAVAKALREDYEWFFRSVPGEDYGNSKAYAFANVAASMDKFTSPLYLKAVAEASAGDEALASELVKSHIQRTLPGVDFMRSLKKLSISANIDVRRSETVFRFMKGENFFGPEKRDPRSFLATPGMLALWDKHLKKYADDLDAFSARTREADQGDKRAMSVRGWQFDLVDQKRSVIEMSLGASKLRSAKDTEKTFAHEFSHHLEKTVGPEEWEAVKKAYESALDARSKELFASGAAKSVEDARSKLVGKTDTGAQSDYRFQDVHEWFAENMADAMLASSKSAVDKFVNSLPVQVRKLARFALDFFRDLMGWRSGTEKQYREFLYSIIDGERDTSARTASSAIKAYEEIGKAIQKESGDSRLGLEDLLREALKIKGDPLKLDAFLRSSETRKSYKLTPEEDYAVYKALNTKGGFLASLAESVDAKAAKDAVIANASKRYDFQKYKLSQLTAGEFSPSLGSREATFVGSSAADPLIGRTTESFSMKKPLDTATLESALDKKGDALVISWDEYLKLDKEKLKKLEENWLDVKVLKGSPFKFREDGSLEVDSRDAHIFDGVLENLGGTFERVPFKTSSTAAARSAMDAKKSGMEKTFSMNETYAFLEFGGKSPYGEDDKVFSSTKKSGYPYFLGSLPDMAKAAGAEVRESVTGDAMDAMQALGTPGLVTRSALVKIGIDDSVAGNFFVDPAGAFKFRKSEETGPVFNALMRKFPDDKSPDFALIDDVVTDALAVGRSTAETARDVSSFLATLLDERSSAVKPEEMAKIVRSSWFQELFGTVEQYVARESAMAVIRAASEGDGKKMAELVDKFNAAVTDVAKRNSYKQAGSVAVAKVAAFLRETGYIQDSVSPGKAVAALMAKDPEAFNDIAKHVSTWDRSMLEASPAKESAFGFALEKLVLASNPGLKQGKLKESRLFARPGKQADEAAEVAAEDSGLDAAVDVGETLASGRGKDLQDQLVDAVWHHIDDVKRESDETFVSKFLIDAARPETFATPMKAMWHPYNYKVVAGRMADFLSSAWASVKDGKPLDSALIRLVRKKLDNPNVGPEGAQKLMDGGLFTPLSDMFQFLRGGSEMYDVMTDFEFSGKGMKEFKESGLTVKVGGENYSDPETALAAMLSGNKEAEFFNPSTGAKKAFDEKNWYKSPLFSAYVNDLESKVGARLWSDTPEGTVDNVLKAMAEIDASGLSNKTLRQMDAVKRAVQKQDGRVIEVTSDVIRKKSKTPELAKAVDEFVNESRIKRGLANFVSSKERVAKDSKNPTDRRLQEDLSAPLSEVLGKEFGITDGKLEVNVDESNSSRLTYKLDDDGMPAGAAKISLPERGPMLDAAEEIGTKTMSLNRAYAEAGESIFSKDLFPFLSVTGTVSAKANGVPVEYRFELENGTVSVYELDDYQMKPKMVALDPQAKDMESEGISVSDC